MLSYEAKNYAQALLELANKRGEVTKELDECQRLLAVIRENPKLLRGFTSAFVSKSEKLRVLEDAFKAHLSRDLYALISLLIHRSSLHMLVEILEDLILLANAELGIVEGEVSSAVPLNQEQIARLEAAVGRKFNRRVRLVNRVDKRLLAGLKVEVDNHVIELSIASLLEGTRELLIRGKQRGRGWL